jgi:hypothetical protein
VTISNVSSTATQTVTDPLGKPQTITKVPTALVVTDPNGASYTWLVNDGSGNYGIPNKNAGGSGGNSFPISTFQIPGINFKMYPHQSYKFELAIEGAGSGETSST